MASVEFEAHSPENLGAKQCKGAAHIPIACTPPNPQLERLARAGTSVRKVSRRDLPLVCALGLDGATTVSATMLLAARAGISVFVTGGEAMHHDAPDGACSVAGGSGQQKAASRCCQCSGCAAVDAPQVLKGKLLASVQLLPVAHPALTAHCVCRHRRRAPRWRGQHGHFCRPHGARAHASETSFSLYMVLLPCLPA